MSEEELQNGSERVFEGGLILLADTVLAATDEDTHLGSLLLPLFQHESIAVSLPSYPRLSVSVVHFCPVTHF